MIGVVAAVSLACAAQNLRDAAAWLGYSYLFVRMLRAPGLYGVPIGLCERVSMLRCPSRRAGGPPFLLASKASAAPCLLPPGLCRVLPEQGSVLEMKQSKAVFSLP
eukprot:695656-Pelagomonas_calceolata.AAC.1